MNERIKELAEQVGFGPAWFEESPPGYPALPKEGMLKEFAELIIQECAQVAIDHDPFWGASVDQNIKQHFGVKE